MKKQTRNRRSSSNCSNYSQHSSSLANIQTPDPQQRDREKDKKIQYNEMQKLYFVTIYNQIKAFKQANRDADLQTLNKWRQLLRAGIRENRQLFNYLLETANILKTNAQHIQVTKSTQIKNLKIAHQEEMKIMEIQVNKRIIDINAHFSRKQQEYKQTIYKFIDTLHKSQRNWSKIYTQLSTRIKKTQQVFRRKLEVQNKNQAIYQQIYLFADELQTQCQQQQQDSLRSINLSYDQLAPQILKMEERRNTIDISSIQQIEQVQGLQEARGRDRFEDCLIQMICWGFFVEKNQNNIKKLIQITKNLENPQAIVREPIFPIIIQSIKLYLDLDKQASILQSNDNQQGCKV